jgi:MarR family transcriptional regulator, organic hydroperoxide resistance regulator
LRQARIFVPPSTVSHPDLLVEGTDTKFREMIYLMVLTFGRLQFFREAFGRAMSLSGSQFVVLMGAAHRQGREGVSIRALADHTHLAATHVTTEVGKLIAKGLLTKSANLHDRRSVLVRLSPAGEKAVGEVTPLVRRVNDILFQHVTAKELTTIVEFLNALSLNSEYAAVEVRRSEHDRKVRGMGA